MSKNTRDIIIVVLVVIAGGALFFLTRGTETQPYQKESIAVERDLAPIELSQEEEQALLDEGIEALSGEEDALSKELQSVRSSDEIDAIDADINETDLFGLDAALEAIESDLSGM